MVINQLEKFKIITIITKTTINQATQSNGANPRQTTQNKTG